MKINKDTIFSIAIDYPCKYEFKNLLPLLLSLETSGFKGNLVLHHNFVEEKEIAFIKNYNIILEKVNPIPSYKGTFDSGGEPRGIDSESDFLDNGSKGTTSAGQSQVKRFFYIKHFLENNDINEDVYFQLADARDTWYQKDPFDKEILDKSPNKITVSKIGFLSKPDGWKIGEREWGSGVIRKSYGEEILESLKEKPLIGQACVTARSNEFKIYIDAMVREIETLQKNERINVACDEPVFQKWAFENESLLNILHYQNKLITHVAFLSCVEYMVTDECIYLTGPHNYDSMGMNYGLPHGVAPTVFHHVDRSKPIIEYINRRVEGWTKERNLPYDTPYLFMR